MIASYATPVSCQPFKHINDLLYFQSTQALRCSCGESATRMVDCTPLPQASA